MSFRSLLKRLQKKHYPASVRAFADALGIDASRISRGTPFDVRGCLRLAQLTGEDPTLILRAAGKSDIAALIESLYGTSRPQLSADQRAMLTAYQQLSVEKRPTVLLIARALAAPGGAGSAGDPAEGGGDGGPMPPVGEPPQTMREFHERRTRLVR
jgi:hypothetical protein